MDLKKSTQNPYFIHYLIILTSKINKAKVPPTSVPRAVVRYNLHAALLISTLKTQNAKENPSDAEIIIIAKHKWILNNTL